jgi:hypothetical protein
MSHLVKFVADQILQFWPPYSIPDDGNWGRGGWASITLTVDPDVRQATLAFVAAQLGAQLGDRYAGSEPAPQGEAVQLP